MQFLISCGKMLINCWRYDLFLSYGSFNILAIISTLLKTVIYLIKKCHDEKCETVAV